MSTSMSRAGRWAKIGVATTRQAWRQHRNLAARDGLLVPASLGMWPALANEPLVHPRLVSGVSQSMRLVAVVELPATEDAEVTSRLLTAAYQASQHGPIALLLHPGSRTAVERELDPLVAS